MDENLPIRPTEPLSDVGNKDSSKEGNNHISQISKPLKAWLTALALNPGIVGLVVEQLNSNPDQDED